jgi:selenocysteine lyase/cysteine desulfurase
MSDPIVGLQVMRALIEGVLRIGLAHYNTVEEIDAIIASLKALLA